MSEKLNKPTIDRIDFPSQLEAFPYAGYPFGPFSTEISSGTVAPFVKALGIRFVPGLGQLLQMLLVQITEEQDEGCRMFVASNDELRIVETGLTEQDALAGFLTFMAADYKNWKSSDEATLAPDALELKRRYQTYVA